MTILDLVLTAPEGEYLIGTGSILKLPFVTFLGESSESSLPFFPPRSRIDCANITTVAGLVTLEPLPGLGIIDFRATQDVSEHMLDVKFTLVLDGMVRIQMCNSLGELISTLVESYLPPVCAYVSAQRAALLSASNLSLRTRAEIKAVTGPVKARRSAFATSNVLKCSHWSTRNSAH